MFASVPSCPPASKALGLEERVLASPRSLRTSDCVSSMPHQKRFINKSMCLPATPHLSMQFNFESLSIQTIPSRHGFSQPPTRPSAVAHDDADVHSFDPTNVILPPPTRYRKGPILQQCMTLTVQSGPPYEIMSASTSLCQELHFSEGQLQGRRIGLLYGPDTDSSRIAFAIKALIHSTRARSIVLPAVWLYGRDGATHIFKVACELAPASDHPTTSSCTLQLLSIEESGVTADASQEKKNQLRCMMRSRSNFLTGLEIQQELQQHGCRRIDSKNETIDEDLWSLLLCA